MTAYSPLHLTTLGQGFRTPEGALTDPGLAAQVLAYRRRVIGGAAWLTPGELEGFLPRGQLYVTPETRGALFFLVLGDGEPFLVSARGVVLGGKLPLLDEARAIAPRVRGRAVIAGELVLPRAEGEPSSPDLAAFFAREAAAPVADLAFVGRDLLDGGDAEASMPLGTYPERLAVVQRLLKERRSLRPAATDMVHTPGAALARFRDVTAPGQFGGLLLHSAQGRLFHVRAPFALTALVVGYTERTDAPQEAASVLLGLSRPGDQVQLIGASSRLGDDRTRAELLTALSARATTSSYRAPGAHGELYRFVRPEQRVEVAVVELAREDSSGRPLRAMTLSHGPKGYAPVAPLPSVSLVGPLDVRVLSEKEAKGRNADLSQALAHGPLPQAAEAAVPASLGKSQLLRREVWVKDVKGQRSVRKLVAWKTNKEGQDPSFPAYALHFTDYSPGRKEPLEREVHLAPSESALSSLAEELVREKIKKGWERVGLGEGRVARDSVQNFRGSGQQRGMGRFGRRGG